MLSNEHSSYIAFGRGPNSSDSKTIKIGAQRDIFLHGLKSTLLDRQGFGSLRATKKLGKSIENIHPDLIHLHNIHGYYLNSEFLFNYLKIKKTPVVWTLHDCWPFTGHCAHFDFVGCEKWKTHCEKCPLTNRYPKSFFIDNSWNNFEKKKRLFTGLENLTLVTPSKWLKSQVENSFLSGYETLIINNGVDLDKFQVLTDVPSESEKIILGVASTWDRIKGLPDFIKLREALPDKFNIVLIGLNNKQINSLPKGIEGIQRTENIEELVCWYNRAMVFVNPTYVDNFPTTNLEALACGTPVITYNSGGSPEAIDDKTGFVIPKRDIPEMVSAIETVSTMGKQNYQQHCRTRAEKYFNKQDRINDYLHLYKKVIT